MAIYNRTRQGRSPKLHDVARMISTIYTPWLPDKYPRRSGEIVHEIVGVTWGASGLSIEIAQSFQSPVSIKILFPLARAYQCIDEGYRLAEIPCGDALIYSASHSRYLTAFRESAASTMDSFPLIHWIVVSPNQCVDVLSESEPSVLTLPQHP